MSDSETMRKGTEMRRKLLGDAWVERANKNNYNDPVMKEFIEVATESCSARCGRGRGWI